MRAPAILYCRLENWISMNLPKRDELLLRDVLALPAGGGGGWGGRGRQSTVLSTQPCNRPSASGVMFACARTECLKDRIGLEDGVS